MNVDHLFSLGCCSGFHQLVSSSREPPVGPVRLLSCGQDADLQERLCGLVPAGLRHQRSVPLPRTHQPRLQPSEEHQGPVQGHLQEEGGGGSVHT